MGRKGQTHGGKVVFWLGCANLLALKIIDLLLVPYRTCSDTADVCRKQRRTFPTHADDRPHRSREQKNVAAVLKGLHQEALNKGSSLRFDWTNLPPLTPLGREIERSQSQCLDVKAVKEHGPQQIVHFELMASGMGSSLHTWMEPLCHAVENNKVLITGGDLWMWNDNEACPQEFQRKQALKPKDWPTPSDKMEWDVPEYSSLWCFFGWHESALRCPPGTLAWNESVADYGMDWRAYSCDSITDNYGRMGMHAAVAEWLFQNVSQLVIKEAERQIREEAFPVATNSTLRPETASHNRFHRWIGMPDPSSLITVHIRWGDKASEMDLVSIDEVVNAILSLLTPDELSGQKLVHIYVASEDPGALIKFHEAAMVRNWQVHASGPTNRMAGSYSMMSLAYDSRKAGLQSLAALLIALQANRYVLTRGSNWSRLIDELRKSVLDSRCGNCTVMIDLREGEVR